MKKTLKIFRSTLTTLVPEIPDEVLDWTACVNEDKLLMCYKKVIFNDFVILL